MPDNLTIIDKKENTCYNTKNTQGSAGSSLRVFLYFGVGGF